MNKLLMILLTAATLSLALGPCTTNVAFDPLRTGAEHPVSIPALPFPDSAYYDSADGKISFPEGALENNISVPLFGLDFGHSVPADQLNQEDGFSPTGRILFGLEVGRSGIEIDSLPQNPEDGPSASDSVLLIKVTDDGAGSELVPIEVGLEKFGQDLKTKTHILYIEPFLPLDPGTEYVAVIKGGRTGVKDENGRPIGSSSIFQNIKDNKDIPPSYEEIGEKYNGEGGIFDFLETVVSPPIHRRRIALANSFKTRSEASLYQDLEQIHETVQTEPFEWNLSLCPDNPPLARCGIPNRPPQTDEERFFCELSQLRKDLEYVPDADDFTPVLGLFDTRNYQNQDGLFTRSADGPEQHGRNRISFLLTLPKDNPNPPLIIFQHPSSSRKERLLLLAGYMARQGYAMIGTDVVEHNFRNSQNIRNPTIFVENLITTMLSQFDFHDLNNLARFRDNMRQTNVEQFHLVKLIRDELADALDGVTGFSEIFYIGESLGSFLGIPFLVIEPDVGAACLWVCGGKFIDSLREGAELGYEEGMFNLLLKVFSGGGTDDPLKVSNMLESVAAGQVLFDVVEPANFGAVLLGSRGAALGLGSKNVLFFQSSFGVDGKISDGNYRALAASMGIPIVGAGSTPLKPLPGIPYVQIPLLGLSGNIDIPGYGPVTAGMQQYDSVTIPFGDPDLEEGPFPQVADSTHANLIRSQEAQQQASQFFDSYRASGATPKVATIDRPE